MKRFIYLAAWLNAIGLLGILMSGCNSAAVVEPTRVTANATATLPIAGATSIPTVAFSTASPNPPTGSTDNTVSAHLGESFKLKIGQAALMQDTPEKFGIDFHSLIQDSRCPTRVNCVWMGEAQIYVGVRRGAILLPPLFNLTTNPAAGKPSVTYLDYMIHLTNLEPYPQNEFAAQEIKKEDYVATFVVTEVLPSPTAPGATP